MLRSCALGDLIVTLPALTSLRRGFPEAEIVLLGKAWQKEFLEGRSVVDRIEVLPAIREISAPADAEENPDEIEEFLERMRREEFDLAIHFQGGGVAANPFLRRLGARICAGHCVPGRPEPDIALAFRYCQNESIRFVEAARLAGGGAVSAEPVLPLTRRDEEDLARSGLMPDSRTVLLHPCTADPRRMWPQERYAALGDLLAEAGYTLLLTGSAEEKPVADIIRSEMHRPVTGTCGRLSLGGLAALMNRARLFVGGDTGPLHLARAVGAPTVGLYWGPNVINWGPLTRRFHRTVISWKLECPECGIVPNDPYPFEPQDECGHHYSFVDSITVQEVFREAKELLRETALNKV